jgi:uncharacterized protein YbaP (TraB family)
MFWRITGTDAAGKQATVYIQGTIHLGDDRLYPLSGSVLNAWNSADRNKAWVDKLPHGFQKAVRRLSSQNAHILSEIIPCSHT